jgi:hypothetical protein
MATSTLRSGRTISRQGCRSSPNRNAAETRIDWHFVDQSTIRDVVLRGFANRAIDDAAALGKCITTFSLPGIYDDGRRATVLFAVDPEYHGRLVISSLRRGEGEWRVEHRYNFEYL